MKRILLTTAYLTVFSTLAYAQLSTSSLKVDTIVSLTGCQSIRSTPSIQQFNEFSPLSNRPFFPGGPQALDAYLQNPDLYPYQARKANLEGKVRVRFEVLPTGQLTQIKVVQSQGPLLDYAALNMVAGMPPWYPAHQEGVAVSCPCELLVTFRLD